jgi:hypothetical protein
MKTFNEIYQELIAHPDFIYAEIIDKEVVMDQLFDYIDDLTGGDTPSIEIDDLCEHFYDIHKTDMCKNFNKYFEMGEKYYYLQLNPVEVWLKKYLIESK